MWWSIVAAILACQSLVQGQVTVTESLCLATYGGTPTSAPTAGRDLLIEVIPVGGPFASKQNTSLGTGYLDSTGQTQSSCQEGSTFRLVRGQLFSGQNQISAVRNTSTVHFGTSDHVEAIDGVFAVMRDEMLVWKNDAFAGGSAEFGVDGSGMVQASFSGLKGNNYSTVSLKALSSKLPGYILEITRRKQYGELTIWSTAIASDCSSSQSLSWKSLLTTSLSSPIPSTPYVASPALSPPVAESPVLPLPIISTISLAPVPPAVPSEDLPVASRGGQRSPTSVLSASQSSSEATSSTKQSSSQWPSPVQNATLPSTSLRATTLSSRGSPPIHSPIASSQTLLVSNISSSSTVTSSIGIPSSITASSSTPTLTAALSATSVDLRSIASEIMSRSTFTDFCSTLLDLTPSPVTATLSADVTISMTVTTKPTDNVATNLVTVTTYVTETVPSLAATALATPRIDETLTSAATGTSAMAGFKARRVPQDMPQRLQVAKRQEAALVTPTALQSFDPIVLSSACSENIVSATATTFTTTVISTFFQTAYGIEPYATVNSTIEVVSTNTVYDGIPTSFETATSVTSDILATRTGLEMTSTQSSSSTVISSETSSTSSSSTESSTSTSSPAPSTNSSSIESSTLSETSTPVISTTLTTTPPVSTISATSTSSTTNICPPSIILASPTPLVGSINPGGSRVNVDDNSYRLDLPFDIQIFDHASSTIYVSTNGILSLDTGTSEFHNSCPPTQGPEPSHPAYVVPPYSAFPFWDDTFVYKNSPQGIYYEYGSTTDGGTPTAIAFEYYLSHYWNNTQYYHYTVLYDSAHPGQFTYRYYQISDVGFSSTVGVQNNNAQTLSPGAPTALTFFCSTCNDNPDSTQQGGPPQRKRERQLEPESKRYLSSTKLRNRQSCPEGTIVPGLELFVTTYANNTGVIGQGRFENCA